jgi:hypothetical protein
MFLAALAKLRGFAKLIRRSTLLWEAFRKCCADYDLKAMSIPLDIAPRWGPKHKMLEQAVYLREAIHRLVDDNPKTLSVFRMSDYEWKLAEVLWVVLIPFKRCTKHFECNSTNPEIGMLPYFQC